MRAGHWLERARRDAGVPWVVGGVLCAALAACPALAHAAAATCDARSIAAVAQADVFDGAVATAPDDRVVAQTCKLWPYDATIRLAAIAFAADAAAPGERELQLRVALLDAASGKVLAGYTQALGEDAAFELDADSLRLDTARYDVAPGTRAIGVVVHSVARGPSCPDFSSEDALTLLVRDGRTLRPVLQRDLSLWQRVKGEPCSPGQGGVITESAELALAMAPQSHAGYADIVLTANIRTLESVTGGGPDAGRTRRARQLLRYDGTRYVATSGGNASWPFGN
ncbi:hypothetical protein [Xanthomonas cannabis]|uniref:hypothetical protein n=1 Tax=Xanthomonas cannabis TaxID=1885674 RepID=UPI00068D5B3F|nr:hypothetical protein [Xanthomonas cannabis]NIK00997.1 hypothetical protein [Xanthomonas cannabis]NIK64894.1 hypothetical protein [Xanthomonas cannabis]